jgi:hypothetical protein
LTPDRGDGWGFETPKSAIENPPVGEDDRYTALPRVFVSNFLPPGTFATRKKIKVPGIRRFLLTSHISHLTEFIVHPQVVYRFFNNILLIAENFSLYLVFFALTGQRGGAKFALILMPCGGK